MIKYLILIILLLPLCTASIDDLDNFADIVDRNVANPYLKVYIIELFVQYSLDYEYSYYPKGIYKSWEIKKGDCTDEAMLIQYTLRKISIESRLVHGYNKFGGKHDWYYYKVNNTWIDSDPYSEYIGNGIW